MHAEICMHKCDTPKKIIIIIERKKKKNGETLTHAIVRKRTYYWNFTVSLCSYCKKELGMIFKDIKIMVKSAKRNIALSGTVKFIEWLLTFF